MDQTTLTVVIPTLKSKVDYPSFLEVYPILLSSSPGRGRARNDGALKSDSKYLLFIDDDADFTEETYEKYILPPLLNGYDVVVSMESTVVSTRVMAISKSLFFKLRGFDETFEFAEDVDFGYRAVEAGCKIAYIPEELIVHREHPRTARTKSSLRSYVNAIRFLHRYRRIILWDKNRKNRILVKFSLLNVFRMFIDAPKRGLLLPARFILSVTMFFYYLFFDNMELMKI